MRRRALDKLIAAVDIPTPWSIEQLCQNVAAARGRRLQLIDRPGDVQDAIYASVLSTASSDYIFVRSDLKGLHRDLAVCHEIGHLLAGHTQDQAQALGALPDEAASLDTQTLVRLLHRSCGYTDGRERDAEAIGSVLLGRGRRIVATAQDPLSRGFEQALR